VKGWFLETSHLEGEARGTRAELDEML
jgi:hypothetical protein